MDYLLLLIVLLASVALSIAIARTILAWTFHLMNAGLPCAFHWKPVAFAAAVYLHGLAGDIAAKELSMEAMLAGDIIHYLGKGFQYLY